MARARGTTTEEILSVNGVVLNTYAKNIESLTGRLRTPAKRTSNVVVPGRHGAKRTPAKKYDQNVITLPMWVIGCEDDGSIPTGTTQRELFFRNVDELSQLFLGRDEMLDVRHTLPDGSIRQCFADVLDAIDFTTESANPVGKFGVSLVVPGAFWQDLSERTEQESAQGASGTFQEFQGATAPMEDLQITIMGGWSNPRLTFSDGSWVQYNGVFSNTQGIIIDSETWSLTGVGGFVPNLSSLVYSGTSSHWVSLPPEKSDTAPVVQFGGTGRAVSSSVTLSGRRKFLVG